MPKHWFKVYRKLSSLGVCLAPPAASAYFPEKRKFAWSLRTFARLSQAARFAIAPHENVFAVAGHGRAFGRVPFLVWVKLAMVGCVGVTRPFSNPRPIQTLHRMLTRLNGIMECHTYVCRKILYDKPNEQDCLYLLTNGTFSASCDKIAQHDATCDKMLPHGEGRSKLVPPTIPSHLWLPLAVPNAV